MTERTEYPDIFEAWNDLSRHWAEAWTMPFKGQMPLWILGRKRTRP